MSKRNTASLISRYIVAGAFICAQVSSAALAAPDQGDSETLKMVINAYNHSNYRDAIGYAQMYLRDHPDDAMMHYYLANSMRGLGYDKQARGEYLMVLRSHPNAQLLEYSKQALDSFNRLGVIHPSPSTVIYTNGLTSAARLSGTTSAREQLAAQREQLAVEHAQQSALRAQQTQERIEASELRAQQADERAEASELRMQQAQERIESAELLSQQARVSRTGAPYSTAIMKPSLTNVAGYRVQGLTYPNNEATYGPITATKTGYARASSPSVDTTDIVLNKTISHIEQQAADSVASQQIKTIGSSQKSYYDTQIAKTISQRDEKINYLRSNPNYDSKGRAISRSAEISAAQMEADAQVKSYQSLQTREVASAHASQDEATENYQELVKQYEQELIDARQHPGKDSANLQIVGTDLYTRNYSPRASVPPKPSVEPDELLATPERLVLDAHSVPGHTISRVVKESLPEHRADANTDLKVHGQVMP